VKSRKLQITMLLLVSSLMISCATSTIEPDGSAGRLAAQTDAREVNVGDKASTNATQPATPIPEAPADPQKEDDTTSSILAEDPPVPSTSTPGFNKTATRLPTDTPAPTQTATAPPTSTSRPIATRQPTATYTPEPEACTNDNEFIADVTIPDGSEVEPGQRLVKTWRVGNTGNCTWTVDYQFTFDSGESMATTERVKLTQEVKPGDVVDISVELTSPTEPGIHRSTWQMQTPDGTMFGRRFFTEISVPDLLASLHRELYFNSGGGTPSSCGGYPIASVPGFRLGEVWHDFANFCLFGLPLDEPIDLRLYGPDGRRLGSLVFEAIVDAGIGTHSLISADGLVGVAWASEEMTRMEIDIYISEAMPYGTWYAVADSPTVHIEDYFEVVSERRYRYSIGPDKTYNPFDFPTNRYHPGDRIVISGASFDSQQTVPLGIYYTGDTDLPAGHTGELVYSTLVTADDNGTFSLKLNLGANMLPGFYHVVLATSDIEQVEDEFWVWAQGGRYFHVE
jgi:hypothetical protein